MFPYEILALIQPLWKHFWGHHQLLEGRFTTCCWWDFNSPKNFLSIPFCIMWIILKSSVTNDALQHHIHTPPTIGGPKSQTFCHTWYCWESNFQCYKHYAYTYILVYLYNFILLKMRTYRWANNRKSLMKRKFSFSLLIPGIKIKSLPLLCGVIFCILTSLKRPTKICASVAMTITVYHSPNIKHPGIILISSHWVTDTKNKRIY